LASDVQPITPARIDPLTALRRHWVLAILPVLVFVGAAVALGLKRPVTYTSQAHLSVGHVYVNNPVGIPTVIEATRSLASVYSRAIRSTEVAKATRRRLPGPATGRLSATPLPESPLITVTAESPTAAGAVALANAGSAALAAYINRQIRDNDNSALLARRYRAAALHYRERVVDRKDAARRYNNAPSDKNRADYESASAAADTAQLRLATLRASYSEAVQGGTSSISVESFSRATTPTTDRWRVMQLLVFVGLVGGLAGGLALALLRTSHDIRRRARR
jgi:uncharacterized protein involved in exopolysaccharide biosynthesis